jgi:hypothetical protein
MLRLVLCEEAAKSSSVEELMDRVKEDDEEGQVDVVGGSFFVGLLDYALHVCRTRAHFRRKLLLAPLDLDFVLRHSIEKQQCCLYTVEASVADPDPHVFGPPGSGSGSCSGSE